MSVHVDLADPASPRLRVSGWQAEGLGKLQLQQQSGQYLGQSGWTRIASFAPLTVGAGDNGEPVLAFSESFAPPPPRTVLILRDLDHARELQFTWPSIPKKAASVAPAPPPAPTSTKRRTFAPMILLALLAVAAAGYALWTFSDGGTGPQAAQAQAQATEPKGPEPAKTTGLEAEVRRLTGERDAARELTRQLTEDLKAARAAPTAEQPLGGLQQQLEIREKQLAELRLQNDNMARDLASLRSEQAAANDRQGRLLTSSPDQTADQAAQIASLTAQRDLLQDDVRALIERNSESRSRLREVEAELNRVRNDAAPAQNTVADDGSQVRELEARIASQLNVMNNLRLNISAKQDELIELRERIAELEYEQGAEPALPVPAPAPTRPAGGPWSAVARNGSGSSVVIASNQQNREAAINAAIARCNRESGGRDCMFLLSATNACFAVARPPRGAPPNAYGLIEHTQMDGARRQALAQCQARGFGPCRITESACSPSR